ncbi:MAG TPA: phosphopantetheine-binding protein [Gemmatimonadaceae bacterium]|nr:phosphopantetheine-binding protein [Gemmatimonadaceae bacterium]
MALDSLSLVELVMDLEREFGLAASAQAGCVTLGDLHRALQQSRPKRSAADVWRWLEDRLLVIGAPRDLIASDTRLDQLQG